MAIYPVVLSGGAGTRLWPLSRQSHPKPFISLPGLAAQSLFGATVGRLDRLDGFAAPTVVCNAAHRFLVTEQLERAGIPPRAILLEPVGRNTAPAITVGALSAAAEDAEAILVAMPSDHMIGDVGRFRAAVADAARLAGSGHLVLFGILPRSAHTGYGYIRRGARLKGGPADAWTVAAFNEKPDAATAAGYLAEGDRFWNSGILVARCRTFLAEVGAHQPDLLEACRAALERARPDLDFQRLDREAFEQCPDISVDHAVMEVTDRAAVMPLEAGWSDLGSWPAIRDLGSADASGNVVHGPALLADSRNLTVEAGPALIATLGVEDLIVVGTADAVLVAAADRAGEIGELTRLIAAAGRTEHAADAVHLRPWGRFEILSEGPGFKVKRITVRPGGQLSRQKHRHRSEHWVVVRNSARVTRGDRVETIGENQSAYISVGEWHRLENPGTMPLEIIEVQIGGYLGEDDIVRDGDAYNRTDTDTDTD